MSIAWKDISSFSQSDKDRTPCSFELKTKYFRITVSRWIHGNPQKWYAHCPGFFSSRELENEDLREAKVEAVRILRSICMATAEELYFLS